MREMKDSGIEFVVIADLFKAEMSAEHFALAFAMKILAEKLNICVLMTAYGPEWCNLGHREALEEIKKFSRATDFADMVMLLRSPNSIERKYINIAFGDKNEFWCVVFVDVLLNKHGDIISAMMQYIEEQEKYREICAQ